MLASAFFVVRAAPTRPKLKISKVTGDPGRLRLSPAERGKERKVPVAFQRRLARAQFHVPDLEGHVPGRRHDGLAVGRKNARRDRTPAIF